jgi:hypothetical protein
MSLSEREFRDTARDSMISIKDIQKGKGHIKDEFDFATDWKRIYVQLYTRLRWLNAFAQINHVAIQK